VVRTTLVVGYLLYSLEDRTLQYRVIVSNIVDGEEERSNFAGLYTLDLPPPAATSQQLQTSENHVHLKMSLKSLVGRRESHLQMNRVSS
jgi:hypothetical protein